MKHDRILVVDDSSEVIKALSALLKLNQLHPICISSPDELTGALDNHQPNLVLLDMNYSQDTTSGTEGLDLIRKIRARDEQVPIVVMTAYANIPLVVEALKIGANDFIEKPWDNQRLLGVLKAQLDLADGRRREASWVQENNRVLNSSSSEYIFQSDAMTQLMDVVARVADSDAAILITGAHGTGKTQLARLIHSRSSRRDKPFIQVNVGALSDQLFESELFGHVKGAFTDAKSAREGRFLLADQGTLFLDEIGNLSLDLQAKLLQVLESGTFEPMGSSVSITTDVRLISATNADISHKIKESQYREDFLFRINTIELKIPPLKERVEDILPLSEHFLERHKEKYGISALTLSAAAKAALERYSWPGNVRELDHILERAALMSGSREIGVEDLNLSVKSNSEDRQEAGTLSEMEIGMIKHALSDNNNNMKKAAEQLGIGRSALYRKIEKYGIND